MPSVVVELDTLRWNTRPTLGMEQRRQIVKRKLEGFFDRAIHPQTLTMQRDPMTTKDGATIAATMHGRVIDNVKEDGIRCVVQKNTQIGGKPWAKFCMSPLFNNEHDAQGWARQNGVN